MLVLLIDDHPIFSEGIALQIKLIDPSFEVISCSDLDEARQLIHKTPPEFIFLDVEMDGDPAAGLAFLDELKEAECDSRIIMLSGQDNPSTVGTAIASGAVGFIAKSARDLSSMRRAIETVMDKGVFLSDELRGRRPPPGPGSSARLSEPRVKEVGPAELGVTAPRIYEVLWHLSNGVKGYKKVARLMGISNGVAAEYASDGYRDMNVQGKDGFLVMLSQKGWKLKNPADVK